MERHSDNVFEANAVAIVSYQKRVLTLPFSESYAYFARIQVVRVLNDFDQPAEGIYIQLLSTDLCSCEHLLQDPRSALLKTFKFDQCTFGKVCRQRVVNLGR